MTEKEEKIIKIIKCLKLLVKVTAADQRFRTAKFKELYLLINKPDGKYGTTWKNRALTLDTVYEKQREALSERRKAEWDLRTILKRL